MQVILQQPVDNLGNKGDIVTVAKGYARNFLFPQKLAVPATDHALKDREALLKEETARKEALVAKAEAFFEKLGDAKVSLKAKAQEDGTLFGSVKALEIAKAISAELGERFDDSFISLEQPLKTVGDHEVKIVMGEDKEQSITVSIEQE